MKQLFPEKLRVYHVPANAWRAFYIDVSSVDEALQVLKMLAKYDYFRYELRREPDYMCRQGLQRFDDVNSEWVEWTSESGQNINEYEFHLLAKRAGFIGGILHDRDQRYH